MIRMPNLPYKKTDNVAALDAEWKSMNRKSKKPSAAVPDRNCSLSADCTLRKRGNCDALHCHDAAVYIDNLDKSEG